QQALAASAPATGVAAEFSQKRVTSSPGLDVAIVSAAGAILYTTECDTVDAGGTSHHPSTAQCETTTGPRVTATLTSVRTALAIAAKPACQRPRAVIAADRTLTTTCPPGVEGVELLADGSPAFDVAVPVFNSQAGSDGAL